MTPIQTINNMKNWDRAGMLVGAIAIWLLALLSLSSCTTLHKATLYMDNHFGQSAKYCASRFPLDTAIKQGIMQTVTDTAYFPGQQIPCPGTEVDSGNVVQIYKKPAIVKCPPSRVITVTTYKVDTLIRIDHAAIAALSAKNTKLSDEAIQASDKLDSVKSSRKWWRTAAIITWSVLAAMGAGFVLSKTMKIPI